MLRKYANEQIDVLKQYYPSGDWDSILPYFPDMKIIKIRALVRRYGIKQDINEYKSLLEASKAIHSHSDNIIKVCRGEK